MQIPARQTSHGNTGQECNIFVLLWGVSYVMMLNASVSIYFLSQTCPLKPMWSLYMLDTLPSCSSC